MRELGLEQKMMETLRNRKPSDMAVGQVGFDYASTLTPQESLGLINEELARREEEKKN